MCSPQGTLTLAPSGGQFENCTPRAFLFPRRQFLLVFFLSLSLSLFSWFACVWVFFSAVYCSVTWFIWLIDWLLEIVDLLVEPSGIDTRIYDEFAFFCPKIRILQFGSGAIWQWVTFLYEAIRIREVILQISSIPLADDHHCFYSIQFYPFSPYDSQPKPK